MVVNKKGQISYMPGPERLGAGNVVSPLLVFGVIVFVVPFFGPIIKLKIPGWIGTIGFAFIILGILHSIYKAITGG